MIIVACYAEKLTHSLKVVDPEVGGRGLPELIELFCVCISVNCEVAHLQVLKTRPKERRLLRLIFTHFAQSIERAAQVVLTICVHNRSVPISRILSESSKLEDSYAHA